MISKTGIPSGRFFRMTILVLMLLFPFAHVPAFGMKVTASILPIWIFTGNVAGERADVSLLIPPGLDVHGFSLAPRDVEALYSSDILVVNGLGLEPFLSRVPARVTVAMVSRGLTGQDSDPHVWLDPVLAMSQVSAIADALSEADPGGRAVYTENAALYIERLKALDRKLREGLNPLKGQHLITFHESFSHFGRRYGLRTYSLTGPHAEQPLPQRMKRIYDIVRDENVLAVFAEEQYPPDVMKRLTVDLGVKVCPLNTVTTGEPALDLYERAMQENMMTILHCLEGAK
jgi:zinc/manganese transport system substrate-binding protein